MRCSVFFEFARVVFVPVLASAVTFAVAFAVAFAVTFAVAFARSSEGGSNGVADYGFANTKENPSDIMTKNLPSGQNRYRKVRMLMYDIYPEGKY